MSNTVSIREEIFTHEYLWRSGSRLVEQAEKGEDDSYYFLLPALLMSFMAFEAFVNFCGLVLLPELWADEKKHFKGKGLEGKLEAIVAKLPNFSWLKGESPYQTIKDLESFRDFVAHGKVVAKKYTTERKEDGTHFQFEHLWDKYLSFEAVTKARADIKTFCQSLLVEIRKYSDHLHLNFDAFEGSLASGTGTSKVG
jgi:hypothetical protein